MRDCVAFISHIARAPVLRVFDRLQDEIQPGLDLRFVLSSEDPAPPEAVAALGERLYRVDREDLFKLGYAQKCQATDWEMAGNLDLVFLDFAVRFPEYDRVWFVEYDVHWEGRWSVLFERFRVSDADVLATIVHRVADAPHKLRALSYPRMVAPAGQEWEEDHLLKAFLPICRLSRAALQALHDLYGEGFCGHYEVMVPSSAARAGLRIEDIGGCGSYVRTENRNRFYFAQPKTSTHSPGTFVFRPEPKVLPRPNTLWHPVKPGAVPLWHPLRLGGSPMKTLLERLKPKLWHLATRIWFATRWRPYKAEAS